MGILLAEKQIHSHNFQTKSTWGDMLPNFLTCKYFEEKLLLKISFVIYTIEGVEKPLHTVECVNNVTNVTEIPSLVVKLTKSNGDVGVPIFILTSKKI